MTVLLSDLLTDSLSDWLTDWLNDRLTDWLAGWLTYSMTYSLSSWLTDWLTDWITGWLTNRSTDRLIQWPGDNVSNSSFFLSGLDKDNLSVAFHKQKELLLWSSWFFLEVLWDICVNQNNCTIWPTPLMAAFHQIDLLENGGHID